MTFNIQKFKKYTKICHSEINYDAIGESMFHEYIIKDKQLIEHSDPCKSWLFREIV